MIVYGKMGMDREGRITALHHRVIADGGGYTAIGPLSMYLAGILTPLPYKLPNFKYDVFRVFTNNPVGAAMRGHGITHARFAAERSDTHDAVTAGGHEDPAGRIEGE